MAGVVKTQKVPVKGGKKSATAAASSTGLTGSSAASSTTTGAEDPECDSCRANVYLSWIRTDQDAIYCLQHGLKQINSGRLVAAECRLVFTFSILEVEQLISKVRARTTGSPPMTLLNAPSVPVAGSEAAAPSNQTNQGKNKKPTKAKKGKF